MGSRDFVRREKKKVKKDSNKPPVVVSFSEPRPEVEVIKKGKKPRDIAKEE